MMRDLSCASKVIIELLAVILCNSVLKLLRLMVIKGEISTIKCSWLAPFPGHHNTNHFLQIWKANTEVICGQPTIMDQKRCGLKCVDDEAFRNRRLAFEEPLIVHQVQIIAGTMVQRDEFISKVCLIRLTKKLPEHTRHRKI